MRPARRTLAKALSLAPLALADLPAAAVESPAGKGSKLALIDLPLLEGGTFRAAHAEGKVVVLYWWASWCPFCAEMSPSIEKLWRTQRDRGLVVLGISMDKGADAPREHRQKRGYTFPTAHYAAEMDRVLPRPRKVPILWVRDRAGRVVMAEEGQLFPEDIEQIARFL